MSGISPRTILKAIRYGDSVVPTGDQAFRSVGEKGEATEFEISRCMTNLGLKSRQTCRDYRHDFHRDLPV